MRTTNDKLIQGYIAAKERRRDVGKILTIIGVLMMVASIAASAFVLDTDQYSYDFRPLRKVYNLCRRLG